jgi:hypothetical protein
MELRGSLKSSKKPTIGFYPELVEVQLEIKLAYSGLPKDVNIFYFRHVFV